MFDVEGVVICDSVLVESGVLVCYVFGSYFVCKFGLVIMVNVGGIYNFIVDVGSVDGECSDFVGMF